MESTAEAKRSFRVFRLTSTAGKQGAMQNREADRISPFHPVPLKVNRDLKFPRLNVAIAHHQIASIMASQAKDRHSAQLARSLTEFNQTIVQTKSLLKHFSTDLDAMRTLTAIHVSQYASLVTLVWSQNETDIFADS